MQWKPNRIVLKAATSALGARLYDVLHITVMQHKKIGIANLLNLAGRRWLVDLWVEDFAEKWLARDIVKNINEWKRLKKYYVKERIRDQWEVKEGNSKIANEIGQIEPFGNKSSHFKALRS